jgi:rRNA maturation protein Rpf1
VDLLTVQSDGNSTIRMSAILKGVKLKREYRNRGNHAARAITYDESVSETTRRFCLVLADVLELPEMSLSTYHEIDTSLHVNELPDQTLPLAVTSPTGTREVGPKLLISRLLWDQGD